MEPDIECLNLSPKDLKAFEYIGITIASDIFPGDLSKRNISEEEWENLFKPPITKSAFDLYNEAINAGSLKTGIKNLDESLGGGFQLGQIVEICGTHGSGRSLLCLQLSVNVTLPQTCDGLDGEAFYVHTDACFNKPRLQAIAQKWVSNYEGTEGNTMDDNKTFMVQSILDRITTLQLNDVAELMAFVRFIKLWIMQHKLKLLVIDNISHLFKRYDNYKKWRIYIYTALANLQKLATEHGFVIVVTNDMTTRFTSDNVTFTPCLADSFFHRVNIRIIVSQVKGETNNYKATLAKNVASTVKEVAYKLI